MPSEISVGDRRAASPDLRYDGRSPRSGNKSAMDSPAVIRAQRSRHRAGNSCRHSHNRCDNHNRRHSRNTGRQRSCRRDSRHSSRRSRHNSRCWRWRRRRWRRPRRRSRDRDSPSRDSQSRRDSPIRRRGIRPRDSRSRRRAKPPPQRTSVVPWSTIDFIAATLVGIGPACAPALSRRRLQREWRYAVNSTS